MIVYFIEVDLLLLVALLSSAIFLACQIGLYSMLAFLLCVACYHVFYEQRVLLKLGEPQLIVQQLLSLRLLHQHCLPILCYKKITNFRLVCRILSVCRECEKTSQNSKECKSHVVYFKTEIKNIDTCDLDEYKADIDRKIFNKRWTQSVGFLCQKRFHSQESFCLFWYIYLIYNMKIKLQVLLICKEIEILLSDCSTNWLVIETQILLMKQYYLFFSIFKKYIKRIEIQVNNSRKDYIKKYHNIGLDIIDKTFLERNRKGRHQNIKQLRKAQSQEFLDFKRVLMLLSTEHNTIERNKNNDQTKVMKIARISFFLFTSNYSYFDHQIGFTLFSVLSAFLNNIFNNIRMNKNSKLLPHLNQLFLQKQSYNTHKKKILQIKKKKPRPQILVDLSPLSSRRSASHISVKESRVLNKSPKIMLTQIPPVIPQKCYSLCNSFDWMSPYRKKRYLDEIKENERIKSKIIDSKSDLGKQKLDRDYLKFAKIKERLMKYRVNPESHKAILKCQRSLNLVSMTPKIIRREVEFSKKLDNNPISVRHYSSEHSKQANYSEFVRRTTEIKKQRIERIQTHKKMSAESSIRPLINYKKMESKLVNLDNSRRTNRYRYQRIKTDFSRMSQKFNRKSQKRISHNLSEINITDIDI